MFHTIMIKLFLNRDVFIELSFLFIEKLTSCKLKIILMSTSRVKSFFTFNDNLPDMLSSGLVYKCKCGCCSATYHGKTKRDFKVPIIYHLGISYLTDKEVKIDLQKS